MATEPDFDVEGALQHNAEELAEHGPGLRYTTRIACAAKCPTGKHSLHAGLGGMGVGSMWGTASEEEKNHPEWEKLPVEQCGTCGVRSRGTVEFHTVMVVCPDGGLIINADNGGIPRFNFRITPDAALDIAKKIIATHGEISEDSP